MTQPEPERLHDHVVVVGWDDFSRKVVDQLVTVENQVAIVTEDSEAPDAIDDYFDSPLVRSHYTHFDSFNGFEPVAIERCRKIFVNLETDHRKLQAVLELQAEYGDDLEIDVVLENEDLEETFQIAGTTYTVSPDAISSKVVASYIFEEDVGVLSTELLRATESTDDCEFQQYQFTANHKAVGSTYEDVFWELKRELNTVMLGLSRPHSNGSREVYKLADGAREIQTGDYAIVITHGSSEEALVDWFGVSEGVTDTNPYDGK
jgi:voltage-gated potassium channel